MAHSETQQGTLMDIKDFMHAQAGCKSTPSSQYLALGANIDLSNLLSEDDHGTEPVIWPANSSNIEGTDQLPLELQTVYRSLHLTSVLYRSISSSLGKKPLLVTLHVLKHLKVKISSNACSNTAEKNNN